MRISCTQRLERSLTIKLTKGSLCTEQTSAFSLLEILCAVLVLGVALTGMIQGVTTALSSTKDSELQTVAALFAAGQIETLRAEGGLKDGTSKGDCGESLQLYRWQQTLSPAGIDGLHEVSVIVENATAAQYFEGIFLHDWERLAKQAMTA